MDPLFTSVSKFKPDFNKVIHDYKLLIKLIKSNENLIFLCGFCFMAIKELERHKLVELNNNIHSFSHTDQERKAQLDNPGHCTPESRSRI